MNLTPSSRAALHELLDISLNSISSGGPTVMFSVAAHCAVVQADIHLDGWSEGHTPDKNVWVSLSPEFGEDTAGKGLSEVKRCLSEYKPKSAEEKRAQRIAGLRAQLEEAEALA